MKKSLLLLLVVFLTACATEADSTQETFSDYPDSIKEDIERLPEDFKDNLVVPAALPESYKPVRFDYIAEPNNESIERIVNTSFVYAQDEKSHPLIFDTMYGNVDFANEDIRKTITLDNGTEAKVTGDYSLRWGNGKDQTYELSLAVPEGESDPEIQMDDLIEIANSLE